MKALCLINLKQYETAKDLLLKIVQVANTKDQFKDTYELEVCLNNLCILSDILSDDALKTSSLE